MKGSLSRTFLRQGEARKQQGTERVLKGGVMESKQPRESRVITTNCPLLGALYDPSLPAPTQFSLVGREQELAELRARLRGRGNTALTALNGLPGVGKTALALALAHDASLRAHFQDGILWAGLGPTPNLQSHLSRWGSLLGLSQAEMSSFKDSVDWGVALRRTIGSRTMLLVIDDAWSVEDALALKVGGPNCAHLITARFPALAAELTTEGATTINELNDDASIALLRLLAPEIVEREWPGVQELVSAVGGLPLALTLIGNYLRMQASTGQSWRVEAALQKLSDASERLNLSEPAAPIDDHPHAGNYPLISLRTVIAVTDQQLNERTRAALHALSVFPARPNSFSEEAALAITDDTVETLDQLIDAGLLEISGPDRYSLHQTVADYAHLQLHDPSAYKRLITSISTLIEAHRKDYDILEIESRNILAALDAAFEQSQRAEFIRIIVAFAPFLLARGLYSTAEHYLQRAYNVAIALADSIGLAGILLHLGEMTWKRGDYGQAEKYLQEGLAYARDGNDHERICAILANLGSVSWKRGDYKLADIYLQEGLKLARQIGDLEKICHVFQVLGSVERMQGNYDQSGMYLQEGLRLARQIGDRELTCMILLNLGVMTGERGWYEQSTTYLQEGLLLARQLNHSEWISAFLNNLGDVASERGNYEQANIHFQEGLELARNIGHREWISFLLLNLGLTTRKQKNYALSERYFQESLTLARQIGIPQITCHALYGYGNLHLDQYLLVQAKENFNEMLSLAPEGGQDFIALAQYGLARIAAINDDLGEAEQLGTKGVTILEGMGRREASEVKSWLQALQTNRYKGDEE